MSLNGRHVLSRDVNKIQIKQNKCTFNHPMQVCVVTISHKQLRNIIQFIGKNQSVKTNMYKLGTSIFYTVSQRTGGHQEG